MSPRRSILSSGMAVFPHRRAHARFRRAGLAAVLAAAVAGCAQTGAFSDINDPYEVENRAVHEFNRDFDRRFLRPTATAYGGSVPQPVLRGVDNVASNLSLPGAIANNLLQFRLLDAMGNSLRFAINTTLGVGGLMDPAGAWGVQPRRGDFGQTLHAWGIGEGAYLELPFIGPSTERDAVGKAVDFVFDPLALLVPRPERSAGTALQLLARVEDRHRFADLVDSLLYESEDSYAQSRLIYLQSRRRSLQGELRDEDLEDPYADF